MAESTTRPQSDESSQPWECAEVGTRQHGSKRQESSHTTATAVLRPNTNNLDHNTIMTSSGPVTIETIRMENQPSLAEQFMTITNEGPNDFTHRLDEMEKEKTKPQFQSYHHPKNLLALLLDNMQQGHSSNFWFATVGTTIVAAILTFYLTPLLAHVSEGQMALSSAFSAFAIAPWTWMKSGSPQRSLVVLDVMAIVQLISRKQVQTYINEKILPMAWRSLKKMLLMEVWSRIWKIVGKRLAQLRTHNNSDRSSSRNNKLTSENGGNNNEPTLDWSEALPPWIVSIHSFLHSSVDRYTKSLVKKDIQVKVEKAVFQVVDTVSKQIEQGITSFLLVQQPVVEIASTVA